MQNISKLGQSCNISYMLLIYMSAPIIISITHEASEKNENNGKNLFFKCVYIDLDLDSELGVRRQITTNDYKDMVFISRRSSHLYLWHIFIERQVDVKLKKKSHVVCWIMISIHRRTRYNQHDKRGLY